MSTHPPETAEAIEESIRDTLVDSQELPQIGRHRIDDEDSDIEFGDLPKAEESHIQLIAQGKTKTPVNQILDEAEKWYSDKKQITILETQQIREELYITLTRDIFGYIYTDLVQKRTIDEALIQNRYDEGLAYLERLKKDSACQKALPIFMLNRLQSILKTGNWRSIRGLLEMSESCKMILIAIPTNPPKPSNQP